MKNIPNLPGYAADTHGCIWSYKTKRFHSMPCPHQCSVWVDRFGYENVTLRAGNPSRPKRYRLHLLVAAAYLGQMPKGQVCCHINGVKRDNRPENLRYATQAENIADKKRHGTYICGDADCKAIVTDKKCLEMLALIQAGDLTQRQIAVKYGVSECHVSALKHGRIRKHLFTENLKPQRNFP